MFFLFLLLIQVVVGNTERFGECNCISGYVETDEGQLTVPEAYMLYNITPNYVPLAPQDYLEVNYATIKSNLGNFIPAVRLIDFGPISYHKGETYGYYTLINIDLDSENNGKIIALLVNVRDLEVIVPTSGDIIVYFTPPLPPVGSGLHRHVQLLFEQKGPIDAGSLELLKLSRNPIIPNLTEFTKRFELGNPIAGNFHRTELKLCNV